MFAPPRWRRVGVALALFFCATPIAAQQETASPAAEDGRGTVAVTYVTDIIADASGGLERGAAWLGRADIVATLPAERLGLSGTFHLDVIGIQGGSFSGRYSGDAQIVSNVEAPAAIRPYELWYEAPLGTRGFSAKLGLIDLNTEFDVQSVGALFISSSFGVGPDLSQSGENGPSIFPVTSVAGMVKIEREGWSARAGLFDAVPGDPRKPHGVLPTFSLSHGALAIVEVDKDIGGDREVQFGVWSFTRRSDAIAALDGDSTHPDARQHGIYAQIEGRVARWADRTQLDGWLRAAVGNPRAQAIGSYLGGGLEVAWSDARWGLAVAHARLGDPAIAADRLQRRAETTLELTYTRAVSRWLRIQPDVQYVRHPSWRRDIRDALVTAIRLSFSSPGLHW